MNIVKVQYQVEEIQGFVLIGKFRDILDALALLARIERVNYHLLGLLWGKMLNLNKE